MRKLMLFLGIGVLTLGLSGAASAHVGPDLYVSEITGAAPIIVDGDLGDWEAGNYPPLITTDRMKCTLGMEMPSRDDFDAVVYAGWTAPEYEEDEGGKLYVAWHVIDDIHNADAMSWAVWLDDCVQVIVDADYSGGDYRYSGIIGGQAQQYFFYPNMALPYSDISVALLSWPEDTFWKMQWCVKEPYCTYVCTTDEFPNYTGEAALSLWDMVSPEGPDASTRHVNVRGQTIGLLIQIDDVDADPETRDNEPGTVGTEAAEAHVNADYVNAGILVGSPVPVEGTPWGALKALWK